MHSIRFVNLTPHDVVIQVDSKEIRIQPLGVIARCEFDQRESWVIGPDEIPTVISTVGEVEGVPPPEPGIYYIVSNLVASHPAMRARIDVFAPDTGETAVKSKGKITAVRRLQRFTDDF